MSLLAPHPPRESYGLGAAASGFRVSELECVPRGGGDGIYGEAGVALVLDGAFEYRGSRGSVLAVPGAIIFANRGEGFSCREADAPSNRRLALFFGADLFDEIAEAYGQQRFARNALPPSRTAAAFAPLLRAAARGASQAAADVAAAAFAAANDDAPRNASAADQRRVLAAVHHIRAHFAGNCSLDTLAGVAGLSRFHFARLFKLVTGETPAQFVLHTRLIAAARLLSETPAPVAEIALDAGFADLSHFNASFKAAFGATPTRWRAGA